MNFLDRLIEFEFLRTISLVHLLRCLSFTIAVLQLKLLLLLLMGQRLEQVLRDLLVALLDGHVERGEAVDGGEAGVAAVLDQELDALQVVLLGRHVQRGEAVLGLHVQVSTVRMEHSQDVQIAG